MYLLGGWRKHTQRKWLTLKVSDWYKLGSVVGVFLLRVTTAYWRHSEPGCTNIQEHPVILCLLLFSVFHLKLPRQLSVPLQAVKHFEDSEGSFEHGSSPQGSVLKVWCIPGSCLAGETQGVLLIAGVSQGLWLHARSLCWRFDKKRESQISICPDGIESLSNWRS